MVLGLVGERGGVQRGFSMWHSGGAQVREGIELAATHYLGLSWAGEQGLPSSCYSSPSAPFLDSSLLALRLEVISSIMNSYQSGFMPQKSMAKNLHRLLVNIQSKSDNMGERALLSLDAAKAFGSVDWQSL